jgi:DNA-binding SARP family transcriptional activator
MLGSPAIALDGAPVRGFVSSKAAALVYYLAATGRIHTRESLAALLWSEAPEAQASKNLRDVLSNLRRLLDPFLEITRQTVGLVSDPGAQIDSCRFEAGLAAAERLAPADRFMALREIAALVGGDFLEGFSIADAPAFEEWMLIERERLRQRALDALQNRAVLAAELGAYQEGITCATRLLAIDPTREEAHRQLMLLLALGGQRGAALAQYQTCRRVLDADLGIEPDETTEALHRRILDGDLVAAPVVAAAQPVRPHFHLPAPLTSFIGRASELAQLHTLLRDPHSRLITITGPGGAGKTRLALQAASQMADASRRGEVFPHGVAFVALAMVEPADWSEPPP